MRNKQIVKALKKSNNVAIFTHVSPDADGLGCMATLYYCLTMDGKKVDIYCESEIPERYLFIDVLKNVSHEDIDSSKYDLFIAVDCAELTRVGKYSESFKSFQNSINIDHHRTNDNFGLYNLVRANYKSCGEVLYEVLEDYKAKYTKSMATALYAAISSDTGRFNYTGVNEHTFFKASKLLSFGADLPLVHKNLFNSRSRNQFALAQVVLKNLTIEDDFVITYVTLNDYEKTGTVSSDVSLFYSWITGIEDTKAVVIIKEALENEWHISFRGNGQIDVANVAAHLNGGGHKDAAGCTLKGSYKEVKQKILEALKKESK